jgi:hypothetical protein
VVLSQAAAVRAWSDEGDDPGLTDRVGPPVSEKEATAGSDKFSVEKTNKFSVAKTDKFCSRENEQVEKTDKQSDGRLGRTGREEVGHGWAGK